MGLVSYIDQILAPSCPQRRDQILWQKAIPEEGLRGELSVASSPCSWGNVCMGLEGGSWEAIMVMPKRATPLFQLNAVAGCHAKHFHFLWGEHF